MTEHGAARRLAPGGAARRPAGTAMHPIEFGVVVRPRSSGWPSGWRLYDDRADPTFLAVGAVFMLRSPCRSRSAALRSWSRWSSCSCSSRQARRATCASRASLAVRRDARLRLRRRARPHRHPDAATSPLGEKDSSVSTRTSDYATIAPFLRQSPWVGRGPGTFFPPKYDDCSTTSTSARSSRSASSGSVATARVLGRPGGARARRATPVRPRRATASSARCSPRRQLGLTFAAATFDALSFPTCARSAALVLGLSGAWWMCGPEQAGEIPADGSLADGSGQVDRRCIAITNRPPSRGCVSTSTLGGRRDVVPARAGPDDRSWRCRSHRYAERSMSGRSGQAEIDAAEPNASVNVSGRRPHRPAARPRAGAVTARARHRPRRSG